ncbi:MAG: aminodeoxychorismate/anthranilate synthase component II [Pseudomonadota bacterium]
MLLLIDNYDSFTYNLVQYFGELGAEALVVRNDEKSLRELKALSPSHLVISPGPCTPNEAGVSMESIRLFAETIPVLGVCLGHQSIAQVFGADVVHAREIKHGKTDSISHDGGGLFSELPTPFTATRYHSLAVKRSTLPECLTVTAETEDGEIMGIRHQTLPVEGVQFHPESLMTEYGHHMLKKFLEL